MTIALVKGVNQRKAVAWGLDVPHGLDYVSPEEGLAAALASDDYLQIAENSRTMVEKLEGAQYLSSGLTRAAFTFAESNSVFKVPLNMPAARMSQLEVAYYEQGAFYGRPVVPCRLLWLATGFPIVVMEKVDTSEYKKSGGPGWGYNNDGGQIARSPMLGGEWAAYDATFPLTGSALHESMGYYVGSDHEYDRLVDLKIPRN